MEPKVKRSLLSLVVIAALCGIMFINESRSDENFIRIAVLKDAESSIISTRGNYQIVNMINNKIFFDGRVMRHSRVRVHPNGIQVGSAIYEARKLRVISNKIVKVQVGEHTRSYRGYIDLIAQNNGKLLIVNTLEIEQYVRGVLYHEVTDRFPMQAMMAQAVAVRSYALYQIKQRKKLDYDVTSDIYSQVYGGQSGERYRTNIAASRTEGEILTFAGEALPAYYHSNSGGYTENVSYLWNHALAPLNGREDPYSLEAPNKQWKKNFRSSDVQKLLNDAGFAIGPIQQIDITERTPSGRVKTLVITSRDGKSVEVPGKKFRDIVGPNELKSNLYDIQMQGWFFDVLGRGWGHGVGLSQWGANEMARQRFEYDQILGFYYPGAVISKL
jgi:stage II sporulation protein D